MTSLKTKQLYNKIYRNGMSIKAKAARRTATASRERKNLALKREKLGYH